MGVPGVERVRREVGEGEEEVEKVLPSSIWKVHIWKRANIMLLGMFVVMLLVTHMELSYSTPFQLNVYSFIVFFQIFYFILIQN